MLTINFVQINYIKTLYNKVFYATDVGLDKLLGFQTVKCVVVWFIYKAYKKSTNQVKGLKIKWRCSQIIQCIVEIIDKFSLFNLVKCLC